MIWLKGPRPEISVDKHRREWGALCTAHKFISTAQTPPVKRGQFRGFGVYVMRKGKLSAAGINA